jgi:hypothetical protein
VGFAQSHAGIQLDAHNAAAMRILTEIARFLNQVDPSQTRLLPELKSGDKAIVIAMIAGYNAVQFDIYRLHDGLLRSFEPPNLRRFPSIC